MPNQRGQTLFPLFVPDTKSLFLSTIDKGWRLNLGAGFSVKLKKLLSINDVESQNNGVKLSDAQQALNYLYAALHSPAYRSRYADLLKMDYPRLPITVSYELFKALSMLGGNLVALHLMESPKLDILITKWQGKTPSSEIEKVAYSNETVWIDKAMSEGFYGIPENVWNFHIGGYQVCHKWLKDRKGRQLSKEDIEHYQKIVVALNETIRLMAEIDNVINAHGGWPDAFQTSSGEESTVYESEPFEYLKAAEDRPKFGQRDKDKFK